MAINTEYEVFREVWKITERRDGCVYKTELIGEAWVPMGSHGDGEDLLYVPSSRCMKNPRRAQ